MRSLLITLCLIFILTAPLQTKKHDRSSVSHPLTHLQDRSNDGSDKLYIFTNEGKIYSYSIKNREIAWVIDLGIKFINFDYNQNQYSNDDHGKEFGSDFFFPTLDGNFIYYSKFEGFYKLERDELDEIINVCYMKNHEKIFTYIKEKIILIDKTTGKFLEIDEKLEEARLLALDSVEIKNLIVFKLQQKILKNINMQIFKESWQIVSSSINIYSYHDFLQNSMNLNHKNEEKAHPDITIIKSSDKKLNILRNSDKKIIFSLETEEDIIFVYSQEDNDKYYRNSLVITFHFLEQDLIKEFITKDEKKVLKVYNPNDSSSTSLAVYKSNYNDDLCVYSNKCLSPSLTQWTKLNNENLESEMLKCMIEVRNRKNKMLALSAAEQKVKSENESKQSKEDADSEVKALPQEPKDILIYATIICFFLGLLILLVFYFVFGRKKQQEINEMNIQANPHSIDKNLGNKNSKEKEAEFNQKIIETKEKTKKPAEIKEKSNIIIDKENVLGYGANGTIVYNGYFQNREMAIKRIIAHNAEIAKQEMEILMKLDHPNIIKFYYYEEQKDFLFLALEKCECTLADIMSFKNDLSDFKKNKKNKAKIEFIYNFLLKKKSLNKPLIKNICGQACKGLRYLHSQNIIHRDLKPENILIAKTKVIKLADFSMSKEMKQQNNYQTNELGTLGWRAKEVIKNDKKTFSTDIFTLGCIFYYIYTQGVHPFGQIHERESNILQDLWNEKLIEQDSLFLDLIKKMLNGDAEQRISLERIIAHPFFWTDEEKLIFICDLSDFLEANDEKYSENLEKWSKENDMLLKTFDKVLDSSLYKDLVSFRKYNFSSLKDLIRIIRNKRNHYYNLPFNIKLLFNNSIEGIYVYFEEKYPKLFINIHSFVKFYNIELIHSKT